MKRIPVSVSMVVLVAFALLVFPLSQGLAQGENVIRIGMTTPLTGPAAEAGISLRQGAELAVEEINAAGGISIRGIKYLIRLFVEDNESKPSVGLAAAEKLITRDKVRYLIGDAFHSSVTMAIMELAPKYRIPIVSCEPVSEEIANKVKADPKRYEFFWKADFGATAYAETVFETVKWLVDTKQFKPSSKTFFAIVEDTDYGRSNAKEASRRFAEIGWKTVGTETVPLGYTDFYPQLGKLREANADVLLSVFTSLSSGVALVKQFQELKIKALHMAIYYPIRPEFIQQAGPSSEGLLWTPLSFDPKNLAHQRAFAQKISRKFNVVANSDHAYGYDCINLAADTLKRAQSLWPPDVIKAVAATDYKGILGRFVFDQTNHQAKAGPDFLPVPTAQIQGSESRIIWPKRLAYAKYQPQPWLK